MTSALSDILRMRPILAITLLAIVSSVLLIPQQRGLAAGEFTDSGISFVGMHYSAADWGDYDRDGDLDLALVGAAGNTPTFKLYANQGNQTFLEVPVDIPGRTYANIGWVDFNNDGQLDLLVGGSLTGYGPGGVTTLYQNTNGVFTAVPNTPFAAASYPAFDWGDYDHDGDLDLLLAGRINLNYGTNVTYVYRNDGGGSFTQLRSSLAGIAWGVAAWVDYDNDGNLDIFLTGCPEGRSCEGRSTKLYRYTGPETWTEVTTPFIQVGRSGADWADYDNDGDLDLLVLGNYEPGHLYRNEGGGSFSDTGLRFAGLHQATVRWADYNGDGFVDVALAGLDSGVNARTYIYRNHGDGTFSEIGAGIRGIANGGLAWGDYDHNGSLDLLVTGCEGVYCGGITRLYHNNLEIPVSTTTYLPLIALNRISFPITISPTPIPAQPVEQRGEIFYSITIELPASLPAGGTFYLSRSWSDPEPAVVDDGVVLRANGEVVFSYDYVVAGKLTPALVEVPRSVLEPYVGQTLDVELVDIYGGRTSATSLYLIWQP